MNTDVLREEVPASFLMGNSVAFKVPQGCKPVFDGLALRDLLQISVSDFILRFDPLPGLFGVCLLQPAIRIRNFDTVMFIREIQTRSLRIGNPVIPRSPASNGSCKDEGHEVPPDVSSPTKTSC